MPKKKHKQEKREQGTLLASLTQQLLLQLKRQPSGPLENMDQLQLNAFRQVAWDNMAGDLSIHRAHCKEKLLPLHNAGVVRDCPSSIPMEVCDPCPSSPEKSPTISGGEDSPKHSYVKDLEATLTRYKKLYTEQIDLSASLQTQLTAAKANQRIVIPEDALLKETISQRDATIHTLRERQSQLENEVASLKNKSTTVVTSVDLSPPESEKIADLEQRLLQSEQLNVQLQQQLYGKAPPAVALPPNLEQQKANGQQPQSLGQEA